MCDSSNKDTFWLVTLFSAMKHPDVQCFQYVLNCCSIFFPYPFCSCMCDIFGARFHCAICTDIDLCSNCESAGLPGNLHSSEGGHDSSHILIKVSWFQLSLRHPTDCFLYKIPFPLGTTQVCMWLEAAQTTSWLSFRFRTPVNALFSCGKDGTLQMLVTLLWTLRRMW